MSGTTFRKIFNNKYRINRQIIEIALQSAGYSIFLSPYGINAYKVIDNNSRFHINIEVFSDGEIHRDSKITVHKDGKGVLKYHKTEHKGQDVGNEFNKFCRELRCAIRSYMKEENNEQDYKMVSETA